MAKYLVFSSGTKRGKLYNFFNEKFYSLCKWKSLTKCSPPREKMGIRMDKEFNQEKIESSDQYSNESNQKEVIWRRPLFGFIQAPIFPNYESRHKHLVKITCKETIIIIC
jgi:hypothetical protein